MEYETPEQKGKIALAVLREVLGFMLIWAFFDKLLGLGRLTDKSAAMINGGSPTEYYLSQLVSGPFEGMWNALAGNQFIDLLLMFGLFAVGFALMFGIASRLSVIGMVIMMVLMYTLCIPPDDNILVDYHIAYICGILAVYWLGGFDRISLKKYWNELPIVKDYKILQ